MPIQFDCSECRSEISVGGYDDKDDVVIHSKCNNCLADIKIEKVKGKVKNIEIKGKRVEGVTTAFIKYEPEDMGRLQ